MKIIDAINFYYEFNEMLQLNIELIGGLRGKYKKMTKAQALESISGYEDDDIVEICFNNHIVCNGQIYEELEAPYLYIGYKV